MESTLSVLESTGHVNFKFITLGNERPHFHILTQFFAHTLTNVPWANINRKPE